MPSAMPSSVSSSASLARSARVTVLRCTNPLMPQPSPRAEPVVRGGSPASTRPEDPMLPQWRRSRATRSRSARTILLSPYRSETFLGRCQAHRGLMPCRTGWCWLTATACSWWPTGGWRKCSATSRTTWPVIQSSPLFRHCTRPTTATGPTTPRRQRQQAPTGRDRRRAGVRRRAGLPARPAGRLRDRGPVPRPACDRNPLPPSSCGEPTSSGACWSVAIAPGGPVTSILPEPDQRPCRPGVGRDETWEWRRPG